MYASAIVFLVILHIVNINEAGDEVIYNNEGRYDVVFLIDESRLYAWRAPDLIRKITRSPAFKFGSDPDNTRMGYVLCGMPSHYDKKLKTTTLDDVDRYISGFKDSQSITDNRDYYFTWQRWTDCMKSAFVNVFGMVPYEKMRPKILIIPTTGDTKVEDNVDNVPHDTFKKYYESEKIFVLVVYDTVGKDTAPTVSEWENRQKNLWKLVNENKTRVINFDDDGGTKFTKFIQNEPGLGKITLAKCEQTTDPGDCDLKNGKCQREIKYRFADQTAGNLEFCEQSGIKLRDTETEECEDFKRCDCFEIFDYQTVGPCECGKPINYTAMDMIMDHHRCSRTMTKGNCTCTEPPPPEEFPVLLVALGSVIGVVFLIALVAFVVFFVRRRRRIQQTGNSMSMSMMSNMSNMSRSTMNRSSVWSTYREPPKPKPKSKEKPKALSRSQSPKSHLPKKTQSRSPSPNSHVPKRKPDVKKKKR